MAIRKKIYYFYLFQAKSERKKTFEIFSFFEIFFLRKIELDVSRIINIWIIGDFQNNAKLTLMNIFIFSSYIESNSTKYMYNGNNWWIIWLRPNVDMCLVR